MIAETSPTPAVSADEFAPRYRCPMRCEGVTRNMPGLAVLRTYQSRWLAKDVVAGLVLSALLVPQGMAYAELARLPAVTGLYTSIVCLIGYAIFGLRRFWCWARSLLWER